MLKHIKTKFEFLRGRNLIKFCRGFIEPGLKVLDLGAGACCLALEIKKQFQARVTCLDVVDYNATNLPLILYDGKKIPFKDKSFGVIIIFFVLHHTKNPKALLKEAKRVLKQKGKIIILEDIYRNKLELLITKFLDIFYNFCNKVETQAILLVPARIRLLFFLAFLLPQAFQLFLLALLVLSLTSLSHILQILKIQPPLLALKQWLFF